MAQTKKQNNVSSDTKHEKKNSTVAGIMGLACMASWAIVPTQASAQTNVKAQDEAIDNIIVDGEKTVSSAATLLGPLEDIPQMINIIDSKMMQEQGINTMEQALRNVAGITTDLGEGGVLNGDQFFIRGLSAKNDIFTDGLRDFGVFIRDSFNYEQIEVLKGASATTLGRGVTGGGINTTSKTPKTKDSLGISLAAGTADYMRATADYNKAINDTTAVRMNLMVHKNGVAGRDLIETKRWGFAPSIGFGLDTDTEVTLMFLHQKDDRIPDYGVGFYKDRPITEYGAPTTNFYGYDTDTDESTVDTFTARLKHRFNDNISFTSDTKVGSYDRLFVQTINYCTSRGGDCSPLDGAASADTATLFTRSSPYQQETWGVQNVSTMLITSPLGSLENEFMVGIDASYQANERERFGFDDVTRGRVAKNVMNPTHGPGPVLGQKYRLENTVGKDISMFAHDQLWFSNDLSVVLGARYNMYDVSQVRTDFVTPYNISSRTPCNGDGNAKIGDTCLARYSSSTKFFNPKASLLWEPGENQHYYVSYATASTPPGVTVSNGTALSASRQDLEPEKNKSYEVGAKVGFFDGGLLLQTSVFKTKKDNAKETDPITGDSVASGLKQNVEGIEIGLSGKASSNFTVNANYTYINSTIEESVGRRSGQVDDSVTGNKTQYVPEHSASLYATYNFDGGALDGLQIGGGANYQSKVYLNTKNTQSLDGYTTFNAFAGYDFEKFRLSVNVNNLTNTDYFSQIHSSRITPASKRTVIATLSANF